MGKVIIENDSEMDDVSSLCYATKVAQRGRLSNNGTQYCFVTEFKDGVIVYAHRTKAGTDVMRVTKPQPSNAEAHRPAPGETTNQTGVSRGSGGAEGWHEELP